ncbi:MAG: gfo/Idh/MocA family oxidoreductase [Frankiales bacterium]|nr:gfo/Idh/MocA family oxidoreductase [Frankiales bacterium]
MTEQAPTEQAPIRVGIVGVGWGSLVVGPALQVVDGYEVVAVCSRQPDRVAAAAAKLGISDTSTDWESFVRRDDLDLIVIATPTDLHHEQALAVVAAGKHLLCEKPVALTAQQAREMYDAAEAAGIQHAVCFEGRWYDERRTFAHELSDGGVGELFFARFINVADYWHPTRGLQSEWMYDESAGGGYLLGMSSHDIDLACAVFGDPVAVCGLVQSSIPTRPRADGSTLDVTADDTSVVLMRMAGGGAVEVATTAVAVGQAERRLEVYGRDGAWVSESSPQPKDGQVPVMRLTNQAGETRDVAMHHRELASGAELPKRRAASGIKALALMLEDWLPALTGGKAAGHVPTLRDGWIVQEVIEAAKRSSAGAGWVDLRLNR